MKHLLFILLTFALASCYTVTDVLTEPDGGRIVQVKKWHRYYYIHDNNEILRKGGMYSEKRVGFAILNNEL